MRILLVEDDERIFEFVRRGLLAEGYGVEVAQDGADGLAMGASGAFDVIVLDLMLPGLDGREVCQRLRASHVHTPILMLTALDALDDRVQGLRMGADDYLIKPFAFDELLARIEALLRRGNSYQPGVSELCVADLILNRDTREVHRGERSIELTPKEFALLEYLMSNPDKVVSRTRILENVWGYNVDPLTNVVEVYIRHLRNKVDAESATPLIQTVRGFGYKIEPSS